MRRGYRNGWMDDEHGQMIAINLGSDFCAEHEWSVKDLNTTLGIKNDESVLGIDRYRVNPNMDGVILIEENKNNVALVALKPFEIKYLARHKLDKMFNGELNIRGDEELATAWDGSSFGIRVKRPTNIKKLRRLYKAIQDKDAAVWLGGGHVFQNAGLVIGIISAIPLTSKKEMYDSHIDANKLAAASKKTGIKERIDALNSEYRDKNKGAFYVPYGYYSLRANWAGKRQSAHPVQYWLNPMEQKENESGWYTVEELEEWMKGEGPVLKKNKDKVKV